MTLYVGKIFRKCIIFEITYFLFISFLAKRNEPKKGRPGVIVFRSHSAISREFQTHTHPLPHEIPFRKMPCSTGDSSRGGTPLQNALRGANCERPETQPDATRPLRFSEQMCQAGKSILSGVRLFLFSIFFFWP